MSFSVSAGGNKSETLAQLRGFKPEDLGGAELGLGLVSTIADAIELGPELEAEQVYYVRIHGHTGAESPVTLGCAVELGNRPVPDGQRHDDELGHAVEA